MFFSLQIWPLDMYSYNFDNVYVGIVRIFKTQIQIIGIRIFKTQKTLLKIYICYLKIGSEKCCQCLVIKVLFLISSVRCCNTYS
jgi:hypothetical protein